MNSFHVRAPGRVNIIGEHTDYTGGLCLPMAIDRWTDISGEWTNGDVIVVTSTSEPGTVRFSVPMHTPELVEPSWGRYVAGVAAELDAPRCFTASITTTIPVGAGLSSSAALEVAAALAMGFDGSPLQIAELCQRAEQRASGVPSGILDQLSSAAGVAGHALILDCHALTVTPIELPEAVEIVVQFIAHRTLVGSEYATRVGECAAAEAAIGPLRTASLDAVASIEDPTVRSRAHHVVTENQRVRDFAAALAADDLVEAGRLMIESHRSLSEDYATSTPQMDAAVAELNATRGVYGARMTGGGFGGCVVALTEPGMVSSGWVVQASAGAHRVS